ncbi:hypothetical protein PQX77_017162 [Marasmius sp. AFHP31]|nr:hypothetical protein PQX77_017162 [Marasmius sp. AFHP31]
MLPRKQPPSHRHATPSGPWPFLDVSDEVDSLLLASPPPQPQIDGNDGEDRSREWKGYPQDQFANWSEGQQKKSGIGEVVEGKGSKECTVHKVDWTDGTFHNDGDSTWVVRSNDKQTINQFWENIQQKPAPDVKVRALFVDNLSGPVLQMLGAKFQIEPFFFSSSLKSIPTRYQEQVQPGKGDHITVTLSFIRPVEAPATSEPSIHSNYTGDSDEILRLQNSYLHQHAIDINGPLKLTSVSDKVLCPDLLSFHVIRRRSNPEDTNLQRANSVSSAKIPMRRTSTASTTSRASHLSSSTSTIISYHPPRTPGYKTTSASDMRSRLLGAGRSVYWSRIFQSTVPTGDPTFIALSLLWYAMYAWDEVIDLLTNEVGWLESNTLSTLPHPDHPNHDPHFDTHRLTHQLHVIRAHLLHYQSLLSDFRKSVMFLRKASNPALADPPAAEPSPPLSSASQRRPSVTKIMTGDQVTRPLAPVPESPVNTPATVVSATQEASEQFSSARSGARTPWFNPQEHGDRFFADDTIDFETALMELMEEIEPSEPQERMLKKESRILLNEIERLEMTSRMLDKRLGNIMQLAFSSVNIEDSRRMSHLAEAAGRDSAVMKQISYLTMVFLPATFVATAFGMNVKEINEGSLVTLPQYLETALPLTFITIWVMMILYHSSKHSPKTPFTFIGFGPDSFWRRGLLAMVRPFMVAINSLPGWRTAKKSGAPTWPGSSTGRIAGARDSVRTRASALRQSITGRNATTTDL